MSVMEVIGIGQLRFGMLTYIERVAAGETFEVLHHGRPTARLQAVQDGGAAAIPVPLSVLRAQPARVFDHVEAGRTVMVTYRGRNVATLRPHVGSQTVKPTRVSSATRSR